MAKPHPGLSGREMAALLKKLSERPPIQRVSNLKPLVTSPPKPTSAGRIGPRTVHQRSGAGIYLLSYGQNNTPVHPRFLDNLVAYKKARGAELHIARGTYAKGAFASPSEQKAEICAGDRDSCWYDPAITPYVSDDPIQLAAGRPGAPGLIWCAEMNTLPTAVRPLSGLETYSGADSSVFPHPKLALESVPTAPNERAKMLYTTGAVTQRNYIAKKGGLKADFHHIFGALIVEVSDDGRWWARQINANLEGDFVDLFWSVSGGKVKRHRPGRPGVVHAINWGDVHVAQLQECDILPNWGKSGVLDQLRPEIQVMNDLFDSYARNHHHCLEDRIKRHVDGKECMATELAETAAFLVQAGRPWCETLVVSSNHDRHGDRWLNETDFRKDLLNAEIFLEAQLARLRAIRDGQPWDFLSWGLARQGAENVTMLPRDASRMLLGKIEIGWHGDEGPNGARGSRQALTKTSRRANIGHSHSAGYQDGIAQAGVCGLDHDYAHGPGSWSRTHILTYKNAKRALITEWDEDYWLPAPKCAILERTT